MLIGSVDTGNVHVSHRVRQVWARVRNTLSVLVENAANENLNIGSVRNYNRIAAIILSLHAYHCWERKIVMDLSSAPGLIITIYFFSS